MSDWREIASAPQDGTNVLLFVANFGGWEDESRIVSAFWSRGEWRDNGAGQTAMWGTPTHWMPLPDPPRPIR